ncbi:PPOX class F420-dependent oxidoreductase [Kitasatospora sp. NPDC017646]|uniref:PPOX class F420-dependent oxidoreductase n=1 Tax=Kitasatospora sp. NPDC017646 TaxID=3364024 RepID=UPI003788792E
MNFTETERRYLAGQPLARLATTGPDGSPQVRPVGFRLNDDGTIDIGGPAMARSQKYRNAQARPDVSVLVDDMAPAGDPVAAGWGRGVEIRGRAEVLSVEVAPVAPGRFSNDIIRVHPRRVITWNLEALGSAARVVGWQGRRLRPVRRGCRCGWSCCCRRCGRWSAWCRRR